MGVAVTERREQHVGQPGSYDVHPQRQVTEPQI
jgi:hypothetical protein